MPLEYPGIGRLAYFLIHIGTAIACYALIFTLVVIALGSQSRGFPAAGIFLLMAVVSVFSIYMSVKHLQNLGMVALGVFMGVIGSIFGN